MMTELLMVSKEQGKIAFKENRTHYLLVGWGEGGGHYEKGMEIKNMEQLRLEATCGHGLAQSLCSKQSFLEEVVPDLSSWALGISKCGDCTVSLGNLFHCLATLTMEKKFPNIQREPNCF